MSFVLTSPEFSDGDTLPSSYQADRDNQSPALAWQGAPEGARSFAIAMHDPDAPTGGAGWWHWFAYGLPADTRALPRNAGSADGAHLPVGVRQMRHDGGGLGYMGCYPPEGDPAHRYVFTVYALDTDDISLPAEATTSMAAFVVLSHAIGQASITAYYARPAS